MAQNRAIHIGNETTPPEFIIVGDSFAGNLEYGADVEGKRLGLSGILMKKSACIVYGSTPEAEAMRDEIDFSIKNAPTIRSLFIRQSWPETPNIDELVSFCARFKHKGIDVFIVSASPNWTRPESNMFYGPSDLYAKSHLVPGGHKVRKFCVMNPSQVATRNDSIDRTLKDAADRSNSHFVNVRSCLMDDGVFLSNSPTTGAAYYTDQDHLDSEASVRMAKVLLQQLSPEKSHK